MSSAVEIVSVGNELLVGKIANTNAQWLARRLARLGVSVVRITVVGDRVEDVSRALREALERAPGFVITTGGLGPTFDDKTLEGLSNAIGAPLRINRQALRMVSERAQVVSGWRGQRLGQAYEKMAVVPQGSKLIPNPVGLAPGVRVRIRGVELICLPGVPQEMKAIFDESIAPDFCRLAGGRRLYESSLRVSRIGEPEVAPLIDAVSHDNPHVYVKSHPKLDGRGIWIELHLSTTAESGSEGVTRLSKAADQIRSLIEVNGGIVEGVSVKQTDARS
jgi:molybdenum cofactor synthesis domain-containing protein